jgi:hypothetical protein
LKDEFDLEIIVLLSQLKYGDSDILPFPFLVMINILIKRKEIIEKINIGIFSTRLSSLSCDGNYYSKTKKQSKSRNCFISRKATPKTRKIGGKQKE